MDRKHCKLVKGLLIGGLLALPAGRAAGEQPHAEGDLHAKGFNVLKVSFPTAGRISGFSFKFSSDGVTFHAGEVGLPRGWQLFRSVHYARQVTTLLVPAVAGWGLGEAAFLFDEPGTYYLRWSIGFEDSRMEQLQIDQTVDVLPAREADVEFLDRLADPELLRRLFGEDFFDKKTDAVRERMLGPDGADYRAVIVIAQLLKATREDEPLEAVRRLGSPERTLAWGDGMMELAREIPDSSYAPYAAYYAGCCYSAIGLNRVIETIRGERVPGERKDRVAEARRLHALTANDAHCVQAYEAFGLAAQGADHYLKPRALYQQALLRASAGEFRDFEQLLRRAEQVVPGKGTIRQMADEARQEMRKLKKRLQERTETEARE